MKPTVCGYHPAVNHYEGAHRAKDFPLFAGTKPNPDKPELNIDPPADQEGESLNPEI